MVIFDTILVPTALPMLCALVKIGRVKGDSAGSKRSAKCWIDITHFYESLESLGLSMVIKRRLGCR